MNSSQTAHCNVILEIQSVLNTLTVERIKKQKVIDVSNLQTLSAISKVPTACNSHDIPQLDKAVINLFDGSDHYRKYFPTLNQHGSWYKDYSSMP